MGPDGHRAPPPRLVDPPPHRRTWSPTGATPRAPGTGRRPRDATGPTSSPWWTGSVTGTPCSRPWPVRATGPVVSHRTPPGPWASRRGPRSQPAPATTWPAPSVSAFSPATSPSPSGPRGPCPPSNGHPTADPTGAVAGFADATDGYLPLVCTLNATLVTEAVARLLELGHDDMDDLALAEPPGSGGLVLVPYLAGERTPDRPDATGSLFGIRTDVQPGRWPGPPSKGWCAACWRASTPCRRRGADRSRASGDPGRRRPVRRVPPGAGLAVGSGRHRSGRARPACRGCGGAGRGTARGAADRRDRRGLGAAGRHGRRATRRDGVRRAETRQTVRRGPRDEPPAGGSPARAWRHGEVGRRP